MGFFSILPSSSSSSSSDSVDLLLPRVLSFFLFCMARFRASMMYRRSSSVVRSSFNITSSATTHQTFHQVHILPIFTKNVSECECTRKSIGLVTTTSYDNLAGYIYSGWNLKCTVVECQMEQANLVHPPSQKAKPHNYLQNIQFLSQLSFIFVHKTQKEKLIYL